MPADPSALSADLLHRYLLSLDDGELDDAWAASLFTAEAVVEFPMSRHAGLDGLAAYHRDALAAFRATQHLAGPAVIDPLDQGRIRVRANLMSTHVHHPGATGPPLFVTGGLVTGVVRQARDGAWRLCAISVSVSWMTGSPPATGEIT